MVLRGGPLFLINVVLIISIANGSQICKDQFGLHDACASYGSDTIFLCLKRSKEDIFWAYKPHENLKQIIHIAKNKKVADGLTEKFTSNVLYINKTHSCAQLVVKVEEEMDQTYYQCQFGEEEFWAQLRITQLRSNDLSASLTVVEGVADDITEGITIQVVAKVSGFSGIPGLQLRLYLNDEMVKEEPPGELECVNDNYVNLTYLTHFNEGHPHLLSVRLTYQHRSLPVERTLTTNTHLIYGRQTGSIKASIDILQDNKTLAVKAIVPKLDDIAQQRLTLYSNKVLVRTYYCEPSCDIDDSIDLDSDELHRAESEPYTEVMLTYSSDATETDDVLERIFVPTKGQSCRKEDCSQSWIIIIAIVTTVLVIALIMFMFSGIYRWTKNLRTKASKTPDTSDEEERMLQMKANEIDNVDMKVPPVILKLTDFADMLVKDVTLLGNALEMNDWDTELSYNKSKTLFLLQKWQEHNCKLIHDESFLHALRTIKRHDVAERLERKDQIDAIHV